MTKVRSAVVWLLGVLLAVSLICAVTTVHRASAAEEQTADNTYLIPIDGYAETGKKAKDGGLSLWFTTNFGLGKEGVWQGLAQYSISNEWSPIGCDDATKLVILQDVCDHILINGKTMQELMTTEENPEPEISIGKSGTAFTRVVFGYYGEGLICLRFHMDAGEILSVDDVDTVTIRQGFQWYNKDGNKVGTGTDQDYTMYFDKANDQFVRQLKQTDEGEIDPSSVTMASGPEKTLYFKGDTFNKEGLSFNVTYQDKDASGKNRTGIVSADKVIVGAYDFNGDTAGKVKVAVSVQGYTYELEVDYNPLQIDLEKVSQIEVDGLKSSYVMGTDQVTGLTLKNVPYSDGTSGEVVLTDENINAPIVYEGTCKGLINYLNLENFVFEYTVENQKDIPIELKIDTSNYPIFQATVNNRLGFKVSVPGSTVSRKAIENVQLATWLDKDGKKVQIGDFIYINGVSYTQLASEYKIRKILAYGDTLLFDVYTNKSEVTEDKIPAEFVDSETGMPKGYLTYDTIRTIELKPGFAYVTAPKDSWGLGTSQKDSADYFPVPGGYLKESVLLVRYPATSSLTRWMRPLATKEADGTATTAEQMTNAVLAIEEADYTRATLDALFNNVTDDAAKITAAGITEFEVGDDYSAEGLQVTAKYVDGGSEILTFNDAAIQGFDSEEAGTCECYVTVNNVRLTFTVTIKAKEDNPDPTPTPDDPETTEKGCGSMIGAGTALGLSVLILAGAAIAIRKKKA